MNLRLKQLALGAAVFCMSAAAFAQYIWLDEKGVKQFSDTPPPASVPKNRILKEPGKAAVAPKPVETTAESGDKAAAPAASAPKGPMTTAEREAEYKKRRAEQEENAKKEAEKAKWDADKKRACEQNAAYKRALSSGERISTTGSNGERNYMSDEQRARELREVNRNLEGC